MKYPILVGDVGGTNARFSLLLDETTAPDPVAIARTADFPNIDEAIRVEVVEKTGVRPNSVVLAVAGPIDGPEIDLTNCHWTVRPQAMLAGLGFGEIVVLNDFEAQALAVADLPEAVCVNIGERDPVPQANRAVLGPGTGLGVAGLVRAAGKWIPVAGEGGHVDLGPRSERDRAIWPHLKRIEGRISAEQTLCGRGLVNIYEALSAADGLRPRFRDPAEVGQGAEEGDAVACEAIELFATYLGRVAGDLALVFMARGGVYIAGGIFRRFLPRLDRQAFRAAFEDKAPHGDLMRAIPLYVITEPLTALSGLAAFAKHPERFGIETAHRRWTA